MTWNASYISGRYTRVGGRQEFRTVARGWSRVDAHCLIREMEGRRAGSARRLLKLKIYKHARASEKRASVNIADMNCAAELFFRLCQRHESEAIKLIVCMRMWIRGVVSEGTGRARENAWKEQKIIAISNLLFYMCYLFFLYGGDVWKIDFHQ